MLARIENGVLKIRGEFGYVGDFPAADLDRWADFYRKMRDREGGKYAAHYQETVGSLEALQNERRVSE